MDPSHDRNSFSAFLECREWYNDVQVESFMFRMLNPKRVRRMSSDLQLGLWDNEVKRVG